MLIWTIPAAAPRPSLATDRLKLRLSSDLLFGASRDDACAVSSPLCDLLTRRMQGHIPVDFDVVSAPTLKDLEKLGRDISRGDYHLLILGGTEFGWLQRHHRDLELKPMVLTHVARDVHAVVLLVKKPVKFAKMADLKGKRLACLHAPPLMTEFSLDGILREEKLELKDFFQRDIDPYASSQAALDALKSGKVDCLATDYGTWFNAAKGDPKLKDDAEVFRTGPSLPTGVFVGRPANLNKLRAGLWDEIGRLLETADQTAEGRDCMAFWSIQQFKPLPDSEFEKLVNERGREFDLFCQRTKAK